MLLIASVLVVLVDQVELVDIVDQVEHVDQVALVEHIAPVDTVNQVNLINLVNCIAGVYMEVCYVIARCIAGARQKPRARVVFCLLKKHLKRCFSYTKEENRQLRVKPVLYVECGVIFFWINFCFWLLINIFIQKLL